MTLKTLDGHCEECYTNKHDMKTKSGSSLPQPVELTLFDVNRIEELKCFYAGFMIVLSERDRGMTEIQRINDDQSLERKVFREEMWRTFSSL